MMDISDGISSDLMHILDASGKSACIHTDQLPISETLRTVALKNNWSSTELALSGGEDYELLLTIDVNDFDRLKKEYEEYFSTKISVIGEVKKGQAGITWLQNGENIVVNNGGFDHFTNN